MELNIDSFGEIMDDFLKQTEVGLLVLLPEGTLEAKMEDSIGFGPVVQFYILLRALKSCMKDLVQKMPIDETKVDTIYDGLFAILKNELKED